MARVRAPELLGRGGWIGASPTFGLSALTGKIVVLDFWTSTCINCVRVQRELRVIEERFPTEVVVVGIHSPKFPREHEHEAVERSVERLGISHPVLDDPDLATWQQYGVKGWPTLVVIDPEGYVVGGIAGEGSGPVVTSTIVDLVSEYDASGTLSRAPAHGIWGTTTVAPGPRTLSFPGNVAVDPRGRRLAIADTGNDRVVVSDLRGRMEAVYPHLSRPQGLCFDAGRLIVCDTGADRVVSYDLASGAQSVLTDGLASPWDVTVLPDGDLLVSESGRHRLWLMPTGGGPRAVVAGTGEENLIDSNSGEPGATTALLAQPSGVDALPGGGAVFVDAESSSLRVLTADGAVVTLVGQGLFDWGASDGGPDSAALQHPLGVAVGPSTGAGPPVLYVADALNGLLRAWSGDRWAADAGVLGTLPAQGLEEPGGIAVLPDGHLVVADTNHHRIVIVDPGASEVTPVLLDESWLGTAVAGAMSVDSGAELVVPYGFDTGAYALDGSAGPPLHIELSTEPGTLLAPGPRRWALTDRSGVVTVTAGDPGEGILVVDIEVDVCDDEQCTVLRGRSRHDLTVRAAVAMPPSMPPSGAPSGQPSSDQPGSGQRVDGPPATAHTTEIVAGPSPAGAPPP